MLICVAAFFTFALQNSDDDKRTEHPKLQKHSRSLAKTRALYGVDWRKQQWEEQRAVCVAGAEKCGDEPKPFGR